MAGFVSRCAVLALSLLAFGFYPSAQAQDYPTRPITIVVTLSAGTGMDVIARLYADKLSQSLGKPVVIENKPGAGTMLGTAAVANAAPDGYTLLVATSSALSINPTVYKQISYDPERDLAPITVYLKSPFILIINPDLPVKTVPELIEYAKNSPTPLNYSSPGTGGLPYLSMELMNHRFGLKMTHVPYRATPQAVGDVAAGHVSLSFAEAGASLALIRDGKVRALAVTGAERSPQLPNVPSMAEAGLTEVNTKLWSGFFAPAKTAPAIAAKLEAGLRKAITDPGVSAKLREMAVTPGGTASADFRKMIDADIQNYVAVVKAANLKFE